MLIFQKMKGRFEKVANGLRLVSCVMGALKHMFFGRILALYSRITFFLLNPCGIALDPPTIFLAFAYHVLFCIVLYMTDSAHEK